MKNVQVLSICLSVVLCCPAAAERFRIEGDTLFFDMGYTGEDGAWPGHLTMDDPETMALILMENPDINTVAVTGPGGKEVAGREVALKLLGFGIHTIAYGDCSSVCVNIFLAGVTRKLTEDARLEFHRPFINADTQRARFSEFHEYYGWKDEFDLVVASYDRGYKRALVNIGYMTSRGVALDFVLEAYSYGGDDLWSPEHSRLLSAGVVTSLDYVDFNAQSAE